MMHPWFSRRLSASLDGELPPRVLLAVERHLLRCRRCAERREGLRRAREIVQAAPRSAPPPEAWARLREQMAAGAQPGARRWIPAWGVALAAAGVLAALAASLYLASGQMRSGFRPPAPTRAAASFVTTADLVDQEHVSLSPSLELLLVARQDGGADRGDGR